MRRLCLTSTDILSAPVIYRESSKYDLSLTVSQEVVSSKMIWYILLFFYRISNKIYFNIHLHHFFNKENYKNSLISFEYFKTKMLIKYLVNESFNENKNVKAKKMPLDFIEL